MQEYIRSGPWRYVAIYRHPDFPGLSIDATNTNNSFFSLSDQWISCFTSKLPPQNNKEVWDRCAKYIEIPKTGSRSITEALRSKIPGEQSISFFGHMYGRHFAPEIWPELKTMVRNPYDRLVSAYHFMRRGGFNGNIHYAKIASEFPTFDKFVLDFLDVKYMEFGDLSAAYDTRWRAAPWREIFVRQREWIVNDGGNMLVSPNNVAYFEYFNADMMRVFNCSVVPKKNISSDRRPYEDYYKRHDVRSKVQELYGPDFDTLGYSYSI